jgi:hypothetical protein
LISNGWTLSLTFISPPTLSINSTALSYSENSSAAQISSTATVTDSDSQNLNGGNLTVRFTANGATEDTLTVMHQGTSSGQIGVSGTVISYGGTNFGYYSGGTSGGNLIVYFTNAYATLAAAQQLVTRIGYTNTSDNPSTSARTVQFTLSDGDGGTASASKNINVSAVNDAPTLTSINPLSGATEDAAFSITYATLAAAANENDVDSANILFRVESVMSGTLKKNNTNVLAGSTTLASGESWVWTPATNVNGSAVAAFTVKAYDNAAASSTPVQVSVAVTAVADIPTLTAVSTLSGGTEDTPFSISYSTLAAAADEYDGDGDSISFRVEAISSGTLTKSGIAATNGTFLGSTDTLVWTPATNVNGSAVNAFTVKAHDGTNASTTAVQVRVEVVAVNDAPVLNSIATLSGANEDTPYTNTYAALWAAASVTDVENSALSFRVENVTNGALKKNQTNVLAGSTLLNTNESWVWTPATNVMGTVAAFTVKAWDGALTSTNTIQVNVTVTNINDAPTLTSIAPLTGASEDTAFAISYDMVLAAADEVDADGNAVSFRVEGISSGSLTKNSNAVTVGSTLLTTNETFSWTPVGNANGNLNAFTVKAYDGTTASATAVQVTVDVAAVNDNPNLTLTTNNFYYVENNPGTIISTNSVLTDIDSPDFNGGSLMIHLAPGGGNDRLSITNEGTGLDQIGVSGNAVLYSGTPIGFYSGGFTDSSALTISFTNSSATLAAVQKLASRITFHNTIDSFGDFTRYVIFTTHDGDGGTNTSGKYLNVIVVNDAPTLSTINTLNGAVQDAAFAISHSMLYSNANIADVDSTNLSFLVESVDSGTLTKNGFPVMIGETLISTNETVVWTPATNGSALSAFTVVAFDGELASTNAVTVKVNVSSGNSAPIVSITSPAASESINAGSMTTITATATDSDGSISKVEFFEGSTKLGELFASPYSFAWTNTFAGTFSLTAKANDNANATTTSEPVTVIVHPYLWYPSYSSQFNTIFYGASNTAYTIQFSPDLRGWSPLTNVVITTRPVAIFDPTNSTQRYYRAIAD